MSSNQEKAKTLAKVLFILWNIALAFVLMVMGTTFMLITKMPMDVWLFSTMSFILLLSGVLVIGILLLNLYVWLYGLDAVVRLVTKEKKN